MLGGASAPGVTGAAARAVFLAPNGPVHALDALLFAAALGLLLRGPVLAPGGPPRRHRQRDPGRRVVIRTTPFAPDMPYGARSATSFSTSIRATSAGLIAPTTPGLSGTPSIT